MSNHPDPASAPIPYTPTDAADLALLNAAARAGLYHALLASNPALGVLYLGPENASLFEDTRRKAIHYNHELQGWFYL